MTDEQAKAVGILENIVSCGTPEGKKEAEKMLFDFVKRLSK